MWVHLWPCLSPPNVQHRKTHHQGATSHTHQLKNTHIPTIFSSQWVKQRTHTLLPELLVHLQSQVTSLKNVYLYSSGNNLQRHFGTGASLKRKWRPVKMTVTSKAHGWMMKGVKLFKAKHFPSYSYSNNHNTFSGLCWTVILFLNSPGKNVKNKPTVKVTSFPNSS